MARGIFLRDVGGGRLGASRINHLNRIVVETLGPWLLLRRNAIQNHILIFEILARWLINNNATLIPFGSNSQTPLPRKPVHPNPRAVLTHKTLFGKGCRWPQLQQDTLALGICPCACGRCSPGLRTSSFASWRAGTPHPFGLCGAEDREG